MLARFGRGMTCRPKAPPDMPRAGCTAAYRPMPRNFVEVFTQSVWDGME